MLFKLLQNTFGNYAMLVAAGLVCVAFVVFLKADEIERWSGLFEKSKTPRPVPSAIAPERQREILGAVCPEIRRVLEAELRAGNRIIGVFDKDKPWELIQLGLIFQSEPKALPKLLSFRPFDPKVFSDGDAILCSEHSSVVLGATPTVEEWKSDSVCVAHKRQARLKELAQS